jgi:hypothetical protein
VGLTTLPLYVPTVLKFGGLNLLEPTGPVQTCTGIVLLYRVYKIGKVCIMLQSGTISLEETAFMAILCHRKQ